LPLAARAQQGDRNITGFSGPQSCSIPTPLPYRPRLRLISM
jgi:hypothetical protein